MAKQTASKQPYIKGSNGTKPTPKVIPPKPVNFEISQSAGVFPAGKK